MIATAPNAKSAPVTFCQSPPSMNWFKVLIRPASRSSRIGSMAGRSEDTNITTRRIPISTSARKNHQYSDRRALPEKSEYLRKHATTASPMFTMPSPLVRMLLFRPQATRIAFPLAVRRGE